MYIRILSDILPGLDGGKDQPCLSIEILDDKVSMYDIDIITINEDNTITFISERDITSFSQMLNALTKAFRINLSSLITTGNGTKITGAYQKVIDFSLKTEIEILSSAEVYRTGIHLETFIPLDELVKKKRHGLYVLPDEKDHGNR